MRSAIAFAVSVAALSWAPSALPCGGGFGYGLKLSPDQKIVLEHKNGVETYFFSPHFCGLAARFGLILPVPNPLTSPPAIGDSNTVPQLEDITKATIVHRTVCGYAVPNDRSNGGTGGGAGWVRDAGSVQVIDKGRVGAFDYSVIKADTAKAFTDWLDANQYPYDAASSTQFAAYVTSGFYFVAFKVTADSQDPPAGRQLCGDLGPIQLSFETASPFIPARIAAASSAGDAGVYTPRLQWRIFSIAQHDSTADSPPPTVRFSGALTTDDLAKHPAVAKIASAGERVTELDFNFYPADLTSDLVLKAPPTDTDFRRTEYITDYVQCEAGTDAAPDANDGATDSGPDASGEGRPGAGGAYAFDGSAAASGGSAGTASSTHAGGASGTEGRGGGAGTLRQAGGSTTHAAGGTGPELEEPDGGCSVSSRASAEGAWIYTLGAALIALAAGRRRRSV